MNGMAPVILAVRWFGEDEDEEEGDESEEVDLVLASDDLQDIVELTFGQVADDLAEWTALAETPQLQPTEEEEEETPVPLRVWAAGVFARARALGEPDSAAKRLRR
ncbi:hypothetical protein N9189_04295 [Pirellulaceae bacterium]|nr:hypothetical protein [Pirellulaceae bacterium]